MKLVETGGWSTFPRLSVIAALALKPFCLLCIHCNVLYIFQLLLHTYYTDSTVPCLITPTRPDSLLLRGNLNRSDKGSSSLFLGVRSSSALSQYHPFTHHVR